MFERLFSGFFFLHVFVRVVFREQVKTVLNKNVFLKTVFHNSFHEQQPNKALVIGIAFGNFLCNDLDEVKRKFSYNPTV